MWISLPVCLLFGSAFVVPPTSPPFRTARRAPGLFGRRRYQNKRTTLVDDDDMLRRKGQVQRWVDQNNPSITENLEEAFRTGSEESWLVLFPQEYQDGLATKEGRFTTFLGCAKSALWNLREMGLQETTTARKICVWVEFLRDELMRNTAIISNTDRDECAKDDSTAEERAPRNKARARLIDLGEVVRRARHVSRGKKLAHFDILLCPRDRKERTVFINVLDDNEEAIDENKKWEGIDFFLRWEGGGSSSFPCVLCDEQNMVDSEALRMAFVEGRLLQKQVENFVIDLNRAERDGYFDDLVEVSGIGTEGLGFENSPINTQVVVVAGESGSGKTSFSRYGVKRLVARTEEERDRTGVIYLPIDRNTDISLEEDHDTTNTSDVLIRMLLSQCLRNFDDKRKKANKEKNDENDVVDGAYQLVSSLSSRLNEKRNKGARKVYDDAVKKFFDKKCEEQAHWWEGGQYGLVLDGLVIVVDGVGRSRRLARGLVDVARDIVADVVDGIEVPARAKKCKVVLTGTGLDEVDDEFFQEMIEMTNPAKSQVVVTQRVNLTSRAFGEVLNNNAIKKEEVLQGTISSALLENARMFTEAIVPCMGCDSLSKRYGGLQDLRRDHRVAVGSSTFFMNYAARVFVNKSGLNKAKPGDLDRIFQSAFLFFVREAIEGLVADDSSEDNLIGSARKSLVGELEDKEVDERIFRHGVANRRGPTSKSIKYLACVGSGFEVMDRDEMRFENMVSVHLARLSASLGRRHVGTYVVEATVPNGEGRSDLKVLEKDVSEIRSMFPDDTNDFVGGNDWSLTLVQDVRKAAGPGTMELQIDVSGRKLRGYVDIYDHSFLEDGHQVGKMKKAAISVGRSPDDLGLSTWKAEKKYREKAMFVDSCLVEFVELLRKAFGFEIGIRKRVIVIKECASTIRGLQSWRRVLGGGVTVWTMDFLQPTCLFPQIVKASDGHEYR